MMIGNRKEEKGLHRSFTSPSENRLTAIVNWKKSISGFEPGVPKLKAAITSKLDWGLYSDCVLAFR